MEGENMTIPWDQRPMEIAHLLNPAFCSIVLFESVLGFELEENSEMPYALCFLILPIVLHKPSRILMPRSVATKFHTWVHKNQVVRIGFAKRALNLTPYTKEAIHFGIQAGLFSFAGKGGLSAIRSVSTRGNWHSDSEVADCLRKSMFVGKWFARVGDTATLFAILGVKP
jgi:hypothetical protein